MSPTEQPLGYWVKHVDQLLEEGLDRVLAAAGIRRRHWQVLNVLTAGPRNRAQIAEAMLPFWVAAAVTQTDVVDDLVRRGWAGIEEESYALTEDGAAAVARISADVDAFRAAATAGLSAEHYRDLIAGLARIAENLQH